MGDELKSTEQKKGGCEDFERAWKHYMEKSSSLHKKGENPEDEITRAVAVKPVRPIIAGKHLRSIQVCSARYYMSCNIFDAWLKIEEMERVRTSIRRFLLNDLQIFGLVEGIG